jgi:hypothetical protein
LRVDGDGLICFGLDGWRRSFRALCYLDGDEFVCLEIGG